MHGSRGSRRALAFDLLTKRDRDQAVYTLNAMLAFIADSDQNVIPPSVTFTAEAYAMVDFNVMMGPPPPPTLRRPLRHRCKTGLIVPGVASIAPGTRYTFSRVLHNRLGRSDATNGCAATTRPSRKTKTSSVRS